MKRLCVVILSGLLVLIAATVAQSVEKPDAFSPEWMLSLNIAPVVKNGLAGLLGLGNN
jgi:hypothetical protein